MGKLEYIAPAYNITFLEFNHEVDYVHILFSAHPNSALSKYINAFKSASSRLVKKEFPEIRKYPWKEFFWSRSFCLLTTGGAPIEVIRKIHRIPGGEEVVITHRFCLKPTKEQEAKMFQTLNLCRKLYNAALEQREIYYRQRGKSLSYAKQADELVSLKRDMPEFRQVNAQALQECLQRLDSAFERFFSGLARYPRYKDRRHYRSLTYPQPKKQDHFKRFKQPREGQGQSGQAA